ncbi:L-lysine 6-transaminase [Moheibacter sediminis]|uniref:L-lysine-epsilon aminotransferase n=1 Tax=Moheibacter sediminis TaxID=1434700 RepID=A0A1W2CGQ9_9FLAO|nr:L-lysine 6-transaminase [Moheibacter sediminis]SMC84370.1 L-lysine 6-transaminase [Moheibacter sediminis]
MEVATQTVHDRLGKHILADGYPMVMDIEKSHGSYIVDQNGDEYLDMFSMFASASIGYNHPHLVRNIEFLGKMAINKPTVSDVYTEEYAEFVDTFSRVAIPAELQYAFFVEGGALAVENALKAAFDWKTRLNKSKGIDKEAGGVIHFQQAFHGRSGYTLTLTNTKDPRKHMFFPKFNWPRIINPKMYFPETQEGLEKTIEQEKLAVEQIINALTENPNEIACIIIETIQAEGGDNYFRNEFFKELRRICDEHEILFILDEVQTGIALTGKMWGYQNYDVIPDVISFGKKTQVCGILANKEKLDIVPDNVFKESSRINSTFGGNYIDMLRFKLILEVIEQENLLENVNVQGEFLKGELDKIESDFANVTNVRGMGLFLAFDLPSDAERNEVVKKAMEKKLILLTCGERTIRFRPHLNVTREDLEKTITIVREIL